MRVKSIVINGFKSYAHRQELSDLDPHFNAITGLNGSGKSNVFDALCWVMGISALKKVRAEDPQDLIFKNGHTGVTSATVTLEFINDDPLTAPVTHNCQDYPIITITRTLWTGGREQFRLNGKVTDHSKIKQFFQHCSMNVDNPQFLVMQGNIHKMIGMKSEQILGMLEEASGTKVFDTRRRIAENLLKSKVRKLAELDRTMSDEIYPRLQTMQLEQENYEKYQQILEGLEVKRKFRTAHQYWTHSIAITEHSTVIERKRRAMDACKEELGDIPRQKHGLTAKVTELESSQDQPRQLLEDLQAKQKETKKSAVGVKQEANANDKAIASYEKELKGLNKTVEQNQKEMADFEKDLGQVHKRYEELKVTSENEQNAVAKIKESIRLLKAGILAGENGVSLQQEAEDLHNSLTKWKAELKRSELAMRQCEQKIVDLQQLIQRDSKESATLEGKIAHAEKELEALKVKYEPYSEAETKARALDQQTLQAQHEVQKAQQQLANSGGHTQQSGPGAPLHFQPIATHKNIESDIFGRVAELVQAKDDRTTFALTTAAGQANCLKVVVRSDDVAQVILERGNLAQRESFLAMNKVSTHGTIDGRKLAAAKALAEKMGHSAEVVTLGTDMLNFEPQFETAVSSIFSRFLVVNDVELARAIAFNPQIAVKTVTLEGDVVDPQGIITGGSAGKMRDWIKELSQNAELTKKVRAKKHQLQILQQSLRKENETIHQGRTVLTKIENAQSNLDVLMHKQKISGAAEINQKINDEKTKKQQVTDTIAKLQRDILEATARHKDVKERLDNSNAEEEEAKLEKELKTLEDRHKKTLAQLKKDAAGSNQAETRREELMAETKDAATAVTEKTAELEEAKAMRDPLKLRYLQLGQELEQIDQEIKEENRKTAERQTELEEGKKQLQELASKEEEMQSSVREAEVAIKHATKAVDDAKKGCRNLEASYHWINAEKESFGRVPSENAENNQAAGSCPYYFEDTERTKQTLDKLKEDERLSEVMGGKVNKKATMMYDQLKKEYEELQEKAKTLSTDRELIFETMAKVEKQKWKTLDILVKKVSVGFAQLFRTCLPGATCKLVEERDPKDDRLLGLSVKVAFNGKEKESLSELSGGQRSLLALCLILAILKFFKAPVYILDEVDAALDPSHTQNIGKMLRMHFSNAQFLLVSLKDGMVSNANVIFEVRNTQGFSEVSRNARRIAGSAGAGK